MKIIRKINGISGGAPCECFWEIDTHKKLYPIEKMGCQNLIPQPHLISATQQQCELICCNKTPKLGWILSPQEIQAIHEVYAYDDNVYTCHENKKIGFTLPDLRF